MNNTTQNETTFETAIARLEEIVRSMEKGGSPLEESLTLFEEGIALVKLCGERLDNAERRIKILQSGPDGSLAEVDFGGANGE